MKNYYYEELYEKLGSGNVRFKIGIVINADVSTVWKNVCKAENVKKYFTTDARRDLDRGGQVLWVWGETGSIINVTEVFPEEKISFEWNGHNVDYRVKTDFIFKSKSKKTILEIIESGWEMDDRGVKSALANCNGWSDFLNALKIYCEYNISYLK